MARKAFNAGEVPVGAVVVTSDGSILGEAHNEVETTTLPFAHAELLAIKQACEALSSPRLPECDLYVTMEPCPMCAQIISMARIRRLYFGCYDVKTGGVEHGARIFSHISAHHKPELYGGIMERECGELVKQFFSLLR